MVLLIIPYRSTFIQLESILVECPDGEHSSYEGEKARAILFECYRRKDNGYFKINGKTSKALEGHVKSVIGIPINGRGPLEIFTYEEFRALSNEFFELIRETTYRPTKVILPDYEI